MLVVKKVKHLAMGNGRKFFGYVVIAVPLKLQGANKIIAYA